MVGEADRSAAQPNPGLVRLVVKAHQVLQRLMDRSHPSLVSVAEIEGVTGSYLTRLIRLAWLAPHITQAILVGRQPPTLTPIKLRQSGVLSFDWQEQRVQLGFA
jgi:site-specific DNA recombinase